MMEEISAMLEEIVDQLEELHAALTLEPFLLTDVSVDALGLVLYQLPLAHDIARVAQTCRTLKHAAQLAFALRPYTGEVLRLYAERMCLITCVAAGDGHVVTGGSLDMLKLWRGDELVRTIQAHRDDINAVAVLPGNARFVTGSGMVNDGDVKLFTFGGELERTLEVGSVVQCVATLPDGVHFVVGLGLGPNCGEVRLYHVNGTLVHTFRGRGQVKAVAVTRDGQRILSASGFLVKAWSVATKSLVSTRAGHTDYVMAVAATPDGQRILSGARDKTVRVWLLDDNYSIPWPHTFEKTFSELHTHWVTALVALPDNQHALSGSGGGELKLFNFNDGAVLRKFKYYSGPEVCLALLPDGRRFVCGSVERTNLVEHGLAPQ